MTPLKEKIYKRLVTDHCEIIFNLANSSSSYLSSVFKHSVIEVNDVEIDNDKSCGDYKDKDYKDKDYKDSKNKNKDYESDKNKSKDDKDNKESKNNKDYKNQHNQSSLIKYNLFTLLPNIFIFFKCAQSDSPRTILKQILELKWQEVNEFRIDHHSVYPWTFPLSLVISGIPFNNQTYKTLRVNIGKYTVDPSFSTSRILDFLSEPELKNN